MPPVLAPDDTPSLIAERCDFKHMTPSEMSSRKKKGTKRCASGCAILKKAEQCQVCS